MKSSDFASLSHLKPKASLGKQEDAAKDLYQRVLGPRAGEFVVKVQSNIGPKEKDTFLVRSTLIKIPTHQTLFPHLIPAVTGKLPYKTCFLEFNDAAHSLNYLYKASI